MIETSNPQIDVNALMERVRREAARTASPDFGSTARSTSGRRVPLPSIPNMHAPPALRLSDPFELKKDRLEQLLKKARGMIEVSSRIPKLLRSLFRRQGGFNRAVLETISVLGKTNIQLSRRVQELMIVAEQQNHWLRTFATQHQAQAAWMKTGATVLSSVPVLQEQLRNLQENELGSVRERLRTAREEIERAGEHLRNLQAEVTLHGEQVARLEGSQQTDAIARARLEGHVAHLVQLEHALARLEERQANDAIFLKGQLSQHSSLLHRSLGKSSREESENVPAATTNAAAPNPHGLDSFYLSFENRFRGNRPEIKERVRFYLPLLHEAGVGTVDRPLLDLGCGRGEWLELLQENGFDAAGVDLNHAMVAQCAQRGLRVTQTDAIAHLRSLADESLGAVTGFHIIEHLPLETLMELLAETRRVLQGGGLVILESPNCKNLTVGACNFNIDPTHRNPVFPGTAQFMLETHGFEQVHLEYLSPAANSPFHGEDQNSKTLTELLYGPQDFAVIGRKPKAR